MLVSSSVIPHLTLEGTGSLNILVNVLFLQKDAMTMATLIYRKLTGACLHFRGLGHCHHGRKHGSMQADMVLEKEPRVLHLDLQAAEGDCVAHWL